MTGIEKNPSAPQADSKLIATLKDIAVALLSDQLHRNRGSKGLLPYHRPAPLAGTAVTVRTRGVTISPSCGPMIIAGPAT
jgi:hypothetical protein